MKLVITGASGFIGKQIVPILASSGHELVLTGRNPEYLSQLFPDHTSIHSDDIVGVLTNADAVLHLAVLNNAVESDAGEVKRVNVEWPVQLAKLCSASGVKTFLFCSSIHALDEDKRSIYALSKRQAEVNLQSVKGVAVRSLLLGAVHGEAFANKLQFLEKMPRVLRTLVFQIVSALAPTLHIKTFHDAIEAELASDEQTGFKQIILVDDADKKPFYRFTKQTIDVAFALTVAVVFFWLLAIIWVVIRLQSKGPGIFAQVRVGQFGQHFTCYKFRTMYADTAQAGTHEIVKHSVTPVGNILRRAKLDELPQFWNILRNDMSLVGPRPCLPMQVELVSKRQSAGVLKIKPGITGLAQVQGVDMSDPQHLTEVDSRYISLRGLLLDFKILIRTALGKGGGDKVKIRTPGTDL